MPSTSTKLAPVVALAIACASATATAADGSPIFDTSLNDGPKSLRGFVDLHTHPMAHLGFGAKVFHGAPDADVLLPAGTRACNPKALRAKGIGDALGHCNGTHGGWGTDNPCGNYVRNAVIGQVEHDHHSRHGSDVHGSPKLDSWPRHDDITHQQMWIDWVHRAHKGGLRVMVALAVNSRTLAKAVDGNQPFDDLHSADTQIAEMKRMVARHKDWMEVAFSASDLRRIVGQDKLAIVLGVEIDDIANLNDDSAKEITNPRITAAIRHLHDEGVRYVFPVHVIDNHFGGTAVYEDGFAVANRYGTGHWWDIECAQRGDGIAHRFTMGGFEQQMMSWLAFGINPDDQPYVPMCIELDKHGLPTADAIAHPVGHVNQRGLSYMGKVALGELMRQGMLIDVDHMSQYTVDDTLTFAEHFHGGYPVASGHNSLRGPGQHDNNENKRTPEQYRRIAALGGIAGVGWGDSNAAKWLATVRAVHDHIGAINLGSDINGLVAQPAPRDACKKTACVKYGNDFPQAKTGNRKWNYNTEGVAHIGLFPDFLRDVEQLGGKGEVEKLYAGAEGFAKMWEAAEHTAAKAKTAKGDDDSFKIQMTDLAKGGSLGWMCPTKVVRGDREFDGNGPRVTASVRASITEDRRAIEATIKFRAVETKSDWSTTEAKWTKRIWTAPKGKTIAAVVSDSYSSTDVIGSHGGFEIFVPGGKNTVQLPPVHGDLVREFEIVADTGGADISSDSNCADDTRIRVTFNPMRVRLSPP
jgi:microsomal dipeptidase-like Zn-dependent dipeptidase